jgi:hypothetical protein
MNRDVLDDRRRFLRWAALAWATSAGGGRTGWGAAQKIGEAARGVGAPVDGRRIFPADNPWRRDVSGEPVDRNSDALIRSIGPDLGLHPDFGTVFQGHPNGIPYVVIPGDQPRVPVRFDYPDESDPGPYPIPPDAPVEGGDDKHVLVVDPDNKKLYELVGARREGAGWRAGGGAVFDLGSNALRPAGWTSADAAGLPIFPGLVRHDEVVGQGVVGHAFRFTCRRTRHAYVHPARHYASRLDDPDLPPMGMRVRLKASFDASAFPPPARAILDALKRYGMFLADNGGDWFLSGAPDRRWDDDELSTLKRVKGRDLEVVRMGRLVLR